MSEENSVNAPLTETRNARGAPKDNRNAVKHGVFALEATRKARRIDRRTSPYRAIKKFEFEIERDYIESCKRWHRGNIARLEYYQNRIDEHLLTLKKIVRKGKVNPSVELQLRIGEAIDRNFTAYAVLEKGGQPLDLARQLMQRNELDRKVKPSAESAPLGR